MGKHSLIQDEKECFICGSPYVEKHHIYKGHKCRQIADKEGMWVWLCREHHDLIHQDRKLDLAFMRLGQELFEETHTRTEFREKFNKSYL